MSGLFITFEGPEGAGKTTIIEELATELNSLQYDVMITREPGGIEISEQIRQVILSPNHTMMDSRTEALLYAAARRQHLVEKVMPALQQGKIILCDRFIDSSLAYQGYARGIGMNEILSINEFAIQGFFPDKTIYLDVLPEVGLNRIRSNELREINRLDMEALDFHKKVREGYLLLVKQYPERISKINAGQSYDQVYEETKEIILGILG